MKNVETFRKALEKWRHLFELDDIWTFKVDVDKSDSDKMSVSVNYATCSSQYELNDNCPLDEMDLDIMAFRQAICMLVSHIMLNEMDDDEEDADAAFHKAMLRTSEALTRALGFSALTRYKRLEQLFRESLRDKAGHA